MPSVSGDGPLGYRVGAFLWAWGEMWALKMTMVVVAVMLSKPRFGRKRYAG
jgi:hypothetical protein